jgi:hypothetical protein
MGLLCGEKKQAAVSKAAAADNADGISPELVAVITAAVHQYIVDENGGADNQDYIVRNVRRATWRHTS